MLPARLLLLCCLALPCSVLQFGLVTPARLSEAVRLAADSQSADSQCTQDFARWMAALSRAERWAAEMADSWTKSVTGLLHGNTYDFGDFDECIYASSEKETQVTSPIIRGAYLLPSVSISCTNKSAVASRHGQLMQELVPLQLRVALCVPDSCGQDLMLAALQFVAKDILSEEGLGEAFSAIVSLPAGKLQTEANSFRPGWTHWAYLGLVAFLIMLAVVSTILDIKLDDAMESKTVARQQWRYLLHFSLRSGMRRLLAPANPGSMNSINGIRFLSTLWIVAGHTYDIRPPAMNSLDVEKFNSALPSRMLISYSLSVDTFLAVAGLVCCMSFMRGANKTNSFNWIKYIIHRYARTTPAVIFVILYGATWFNIAYPAVDSFVFGEKPFSHWFREYWWTSLLHISNFFLELTNIVPHTWYLSVDMQLYVLAPVVLIPLWKRPLLGKMFLAFWTLASCLIPGVLSVVYQSKTANGHVSGDSTALRKLLYFGTESRISPYVVGIAAGYFLHQLKFGGWNFHINSLHAALMWLVSAATALAVVFAPYSIEMDSHPYNAVESFFYVGFTRLAWGVSISLVIIACETGWGGPVKRILSMGFLTPLAKLSFALYLVHFFIVRIDMLYTVHVVEYFSTYSLVRQVLSSVTLAVPFAALLHLIVEQPFVLMETELWKKTDKIGEPTNKCTEKQHS